MLVSEEAMVQNGMMGDVMDSVEVLNNVAGELSKILSSFSIEE